MRTHVATCTRSVRTSRVKIDPLCARELQKQTAGKTGRAVLVSLRLPVVRLVTFESATLVSRVTTLLCDFQNIRVGKSFYRDGTNSERYGFARVQTRERR